MEGGPAIEIGLPIAIGIIMVAMGMALTVADFRRILATPAPVIAGLVAQLIGLPALAFLVASSFDLEPVFAVSIILVGACPGGTMSNLIIHLANGDRALSVTLTAISNTVVFVSLPLLLQAGFDTFAAGDAADVDLPIPRLVAQLFALTILPLIIGMFIRASRPDVADRLQEPSKKFAAGLMAVLVAGIVAVNLPTIGVEGRRFGPAFLTLNGAALAMGLGLAKLARQPFVQAFTIAIEAGLQNTTLAIFVALTVLSNDDLAIVPALYGAWMLVTGFGLALAMRRRLTAATALTAAMTSPA